MSLYINWLGTLALTIPWCLSAVSMCCLTSAVSQRNSKLGAYLGKLLLLDLPPNSPPNLCKPGHRKQSAKEQNSLSRKNVLWKQWQRQGMKNILVFESSRLIAPKEQKQAVGTILLASAQTFGVLYLVEWINRPSSTTAKIKKWHFKGCGVRDTWLSNEDGKVIIPKLGGSIFAQRYKCGGVTQAKT